MLLRWIKRIVLIAILAAVAILIVLSLQPRPVPVETAVIDRGEIAVTIDEDGRARVRDRHVVAAPMSGALARISHRPGDPVAADEVIARIEPLPSPLLDARARSELEGRLAVAIAQHRQALALVERARVAAEYARRELARAEALAADSAIAGDELDRRRLQADVAARELTSARLSATVADKAVATAEAVIRRWDQDGAPSGGGGGDDEVQVRAPIAGRILRVFSESEGVVQVGMPLVELGDPTLLEIAIEVLTADAVGIPDGAHVAIAGWGGETLAGRVRLVEPSARTRISALGVEEQRVTVLVDLVDPPERWARLGDGWRVEAEIAVWRGEDVLRLPLGALFRDGERWATFVVANGVATRRAVTIGQRSALWAEVLDGLTPGEAVILHPSERIRDGLAVVPSGDLDR